VGKGTQLGKDIRGNLGGEFLSCGRHAFPLFGCGIIGS
jgi:hypothetical protein